VPRHRSPRVVGGARHDEPVTVDTEAVRALVVAYAERLDAGDLDGVAELFADAVLHRGRSGGALVGADAVRRLYDPVVRYEDGTPRTQHMLGNLAVAVDADGDHAVSHCTFTVWQARPDGTLGPVLAGRYDDRFARVAGRWRFAERVITPDLLGDLSDHMRR